MISLTDLEYALIFYCLNNGVKIENINYQDNIVVVMKNSNPNDLELVFWNEPIPAPDIYYLLNNTTLEQINFAKKKMNDYEIDLKMKADPLYPIIKNLILPISPSGSDDLIKRIENLENQIKELTKNLS